MFSGTARTGLNFIGNIKAAVFFNYLVDLLVIVEGRLNKTSHTEYRFDNHRRNRSAGCGLNRHSDIVNTFKVTTAPLPAEGASITVWSPGMGDSRLRLGAEFPIGVATKRERG